MSYLMDVLLDSVNNLEVAESIVVSNSKINNPLYQNILCSVSGGSDSDVMLDLIYRVDKDHKVTYVWFDTGLEYQATKDHLKYLEDRYSIKIEVIKAKKSIPTTCKEMGQPFISKSVSHKIQVLQSKGFKFEDKPKAQLLAEYCEEIPKEIAEKRPDLYHECEGKYYRGCCTAIRWWCNDFARKMV